MIRVFSLLGVLFSSIAMAENFEISANAEVWALPASAKSCVAWKSGQEENDIPGKHINLGNLMVSWGDSSKSLEITSVRVSLKDSLLPNGEHECVIKGAELQALGSDGWTKIARATRGRVSTADTDCRLICGGIEVIPDISATLNGKIEVTGVATDSNGQRETVKAGLPILVDNVIF